MSELALPEVTEKRCTSCTVTKPLDGFHNSKDGKYGRASWCKDCASAYDKNHRDARKERDRATRVTRAVVTREQKVDVPPPPSISARDLFTLMGGGNDKGDAKLALAARIIDLQGEILRELIR